MASLSATRRFSFPIAGSGRVRVPGFPPHSRERGAVLLLAVLVLVIGYSFMLLQGLNVSAGTLRAYRQQYDGEVLAQAKRALIGYAAAYPEFASSPPPGKGPGYLPCPDRNNDGLVSTEGSCISTSPTALTIGRLPWLYLGLSDLRDSSGERLWYAVADNFSFHQGGGLYYTPMNSETPSQFTVNGLGDIVAVIIAPGAPLSVNGDRVAGPNVPANFLEGDNTVADFSFTARATADLNGDGEINDLDLNDQLVYITRAELMAVVEKRVAGDARAALRTYYSDSGATPADQFYPNAALLGKDFPHRVGWHGLRRGALALDASGDGCECDYVTATNSLTCTCSGTAKYELSDAAITFADDAVPGICTATANSCVCTGTGPAQTDSCVVSGLPTFTVTRADESAIFTESDGACVFPPAQPQDSPTICACTGNGSCDTQTSQHAHTDISGLLPEWFAANGWEQLTYYTLSEVCRAPPDGAGCAGALQLQLGGQSGINALVATTGRALNKTTCNGALRNQAAPSQDVCDYLDSDENTDVNDTYGQQLRSPTFNDYFTVVPPP